MRKYIVDLTNNLIGKHLFDELIERLRARGGADSHPCVILDHIANILEVTEVQKMNPETLGKIMCSFETNDIAAKNPFREVSFSGNPGDALRELVSACLAHVIYDRLDPDMSNPHVPPYRRC